VRKAEDIAPDWQCPSCQVVYAKASIRDDIQSDMPIADTGDAPRQTGSLPTGMLKAVVVLALVTCIAYFGYSFFKGITITTESSGNMVEASPIFAPGKTVLFYSREVNIGSGLNS